MRRDRCPKCVSDDPEVRRDGGWGPCNHSWHHPREACRNQGSPLAERACGYCHEGHCPWEGFVILRRADHEALDEEWALDEDPFFRPVTFADVMGARVEGTGSRAVTVTEKTE